MSTPHRILARLLPAMAAVALCATATPAQAAGPDIRHQEIVDKADGGRLSTWDDNASAGVAASTIRQPNSDYESRTSVMWELEQQDDGSWVIRNEKNATLCLQPSSDPAPNVLVVVQVCNGSALQSWRLVPEQTDLAASAGSTGWWSLRPASNTRLAAAPSTTGGAYSDIRLFRATNSDDRLWHHQPARHSW
ncbi:hypothetical protein AB0D42_28040 [Streptomyces sp. NPDC048304]|jgi:hypothetical protein|uniref:RICIN domain-containing protein n=1 Tax=Streptomyces sp. NPDC048304 TaxID=3154820 RepID=UPI0033E61699